MIALSTEVKVFSPSGCCELCIESHLHFSGDSGVWGLKKNFALLELLERLQNGATNQSGMAEDALKGMGEVRHS